MTQCLVSDTAAFRQSIAPYAGCRPAAASAVMAGVSVRLLTFLASAGVGGTLATNAVSSSLGRALSLTDARVPPTGASNSSAMRAISEQVSALVRDVSLSGSHPVMLVGGGISPGRRNAGGDCARARCGI